MKTFKEYIKEKYVMKSEDISFLYNYISQHPDFQEYGSFGIFNDNSPNYIKATDIISKSSFLGKGELSSWREIFDFIKKLYKEKSPQSELKLESYIKEFIESRKSKHDVMNDIIYYHNEVYKHMHEHEDDLLDIAQKKTEEIDPMYKLQDVVQNFYDYTEANYKKLPNIKIQSTSTMPFSSFHGYMTFQLDRCKSSIEFGAQEMAKGKYHQALLTFDLAYSYIHQAIKLFLEVEG